MRQGYNVPDYFQVANSETLLVILIEDIVALGQLDDILKVGQIDVFFVAPSDLAASMGHIGKTGHPEVQSALTAAIAKIVGAGRCAGTITESDGAERLANQGVRFLLTNVAPWIESGAKHFAASVEKGAMSGKV